MARVIASGWAGLDLLVENRDATQGTAVPFGLVFGEIGKHGLEERTHERDFHGRADDRAFKIDVFHCAGQNAELYATNGAYITHLDHKQWLQEAGRGGRST